MLWRTNCYDLNLFSFANWRPLNLRQIDLLEKPGYLHFVVPSITAFSALQHTLAATLRGED